MFLGNPGLNGLMINSLNLEKLKIVLVTTNLYQRITNKYCKQKQTMYSKNQML